MTKSGSTLFYFGIYVALTGFLILFVPDTLTSMMHLPAITNGWSGVIGLLALVIGAYDIFSGRNDIQPFIKASVYIRIGFTIGTILLVVFQQMPPALILLGGVDTLGALWTAMALKSEASKK